ncbi:Hypothetical protein CINCED_3A008259 [Cinara cedri]|uniref:Uncharacterized protein n=1 Tax=Cinara cedri TaxID=506608 RepID=A0A5E4N7W1_9HEMI|nr:Hypothetical protein CINCED_3A008259 [Cinara cedri]
MSVLIFLLPLSASLWVIASGGLIMYNTRSFLFEVMENDIYWADLLNIEIKVEMSIVSSTARLVLEEMQMIPVTNNGHTSQHIKGVNDGVADSQNKKNCSGDSNTKSEMVSEIKSHVRPWINFYEGENSQKVCKDDCTQTGHVKCKFSHIVIPNALLVLTHIISMHHKESNALEFGLAVIASAIRCQILQLFAIMLWAMIGTSESYNKSRYIIFCNHLKNYLDKMARLKETMTVESDVYWKWVTVMAHSDLNVEPPITGDLKPIQNLVIQSLRSSCDCENFVNNKITEILNSETDPDHPLNKQLVFDYAQESLEKLFQRIPIGTMEMNLWDQYLNKGQVNYNSTAHKFIEITRDD